MARLNSLALADFRNHVQLDWRDIGSPFVVLTGPNGTGKTNILEAVSLLAPGRGLRGDAPPDQARLGTQRAFSVGCTLQGLYGDTRIDIHQAPDPARRTLALNGMPARAQTALQDYVRVVWLTPQQDRLFTGPTADRRRFLDRLVLTLDPAHAGRVTRYDKAVAQRLTLVREGRGSPHWLEGLEHQMAEAAVAIAAARLDAVHRLAQAILRDSSDFPQAQLTLAGSVEQALGTDPARTVEEWLVRQWRDDRPRDAERGITHTGVHRTDLKVTDSRPIPAERCSTGEQKALLLGLILAQAAMIRAETGLAPLVLLDEAAAHLDAGRRDLLFDRLRQSAGQVWLTGTDRALFSGIGQEAVFQALERDGNAISEVVV